MELKLCYSPINVEIDTFVVVSPNIPISTSTIAKRFEISGVRDVVVGMTTYGTDRAQTLQLQTIPSREPRITGHLPCP